ncbi:MAG: S8 family serine peptidase, partial [Fidelibacterota bacterium]
GETQNEPGDPENSHNHGTYTLSTLGGSFEGQLYGPAYNAQFLLAKTEDVSQEVPVEEDWYVAGLEWGESLGADVASSSLGYIDWYTYEDLDGQSAVTTIAVNIAIENGMVITTAAGNSGSGGIIAPADAFEVLACGAVDSNGEIAGFSSWGPTADGRIKPDICARGVATFCADIVSPNSYREANGTSLSTPLVGGAAAVILSAHPSWTPLQVREALMMTADNVENPDNQYGWGVIDVMAAINYFNATGDVNNDGILDILDVVVTVNYILGTIIPNESQILIADMNEDGSLDVVDIVAMVSIIIGETF